MVSDPCKSCVTPERLDLTKPEYKIVRGENMCGLKPNCGKNLLIPNGAGLTRNDIPCLVDQGRVLKTKLLGFMKIR